MSRPFDEVRYRALLEGLEVVEISLSTLERTLRIDAEFFQLRHLRAAEKLAIHNTQLVTEIATVSDGNHFAVSEEFAEKGFPYYRCQDVVGHFFIEQSAPTFITGKAFRQPYMTRSHLKRGDVLLSIIGTIGEASLVSDESPATCSCKLAILRPRGILSEYLAVFLRSCYGRSQIERFTRGAVQMGLLLEDMDQIKVARLTPDFETIIAAIVVSAKNSLEVAIKTTVQAEQTLLRAIDLENWQPPEPLTYTRSSRDAFSAGRLDAEYFAPRVTELLNRLNKDGLTISDASPARHKRFMASKAGNFDYIEISGVRQDGTAVSETVPHTEAPSRATWFVKARDVITSTVRPIRRLSALIAPEQNGFVCSSGFVVLQPKTIPAEVLLTYLRLPPFCELMDLHTSASLYPAISEQDLLNLPIPRIEQDAQQTIVSAVQSAQASRRRAAELLDAAKRAVEIAIESDEATALKFLNITAERSFTQS